MRIIWGLLKKDIIESRRAIVDKKRFLDVLGSLILFLIVYTVCVFAFVNFFKLYISTDFGNSSNQVLRTRELFIVVFSIVFFVNMLLGVSKIQDILKENKEHSLICYPINMRYIYVYKWLKIYMMQGISSILMIAPLAILLAKNYEMLLIVSVFITLCACSLASLLAIPLLCINRYLQYKFVFKLIIYSIFVGIGFYLYSYLLSGLSELLRSGEIKYTFDFQTINIINNICRYLYLGNFFADICLKNKILSNLIIIILISMVLLVLSCLFIERIYLKTMQEKLEVPFICKNKVKIKDRTPIKALINKEFKVILRTPLYAFEYFAISISLPGMVYLSAKLLESMLFTLTYINCNYALAIFVIVMFNVLSNRFSKTNISRDGEMFNVLNTFPISLKQIVRSKILFCSIVSFISNFLCGFILCISGFLSVGYSCITFIIGYIFSLIQIICFTAWDLKKAYLKNNSLKSGNGDFLTMCILAVTILICGGGVLLSTVISIKYSEIIASLISLCFMCFTTVFFFFLSILYLNKTIDTSGNY